jgi:large subunit ribosomal protein L25
MSIFEIDAESRSDMGKGASRRLRRDGKVPAIMYGGDEDPKSISLIHSELLKRLDHEAFYSHILTVKVDGKATKAVLRDMQRHPSKPVIMHMDFQRIDEKKPIRVHVPLHFIGEEIAPGVKTGGGMVSHELIEVELEVLPKHLPEYIEVDISAMNVGESVHLTDLKLPESGVLVELGRGEGHDLPVVSIHARRGGGDEGAEAGESGEGEEAAS